MRDNDQPYPPDFVSADTLAYRLDCSRGTIEAYVRTGILPKPERIGKLRRWDFAKVRARIAGDPGSDAADRPLIIAANGALQRPGDPFVEALRHVTAAKG